MLSLLNLEEIQGVLLRTPQLVRELEGREASFFGSVKAWLAQCEQVLISNRLTIAAAIATLRGSLISTERGSIPAGLGFSGKATPRKVRDAAAAEVLRQAEEVISNSVRADAARFAEAEKLMRQIVAVAQKKALRLPGNDAVNRSDGLKGLWSDMTRDADLSAVTTHLVGLIGPSDVLILLDRVLPVFRNV
jgi:hypothetical protein